jgi:MraZ protein
VDTAYLSVIEPLLGTEEANIDEKGRVLFSNKKRARLGAQFTVTVGPEGCLVAYPRAQWVAILEEIFKSDLTNSGRRNYSRAFFRLADDDMKFDAQGRTVIPQRLREQCGLTDKVLLVGCGDRVEIWSKDAYAAFEKDQDGYAKDRREKMDESARLMKGE